jgi:subtilisin family serine protease
MLAMSRLPSSVFQSICCLIAAGLLFAVAPAAAQGGRTVVTDQTQLPRVAYPMPMSPSTLLTADNATFAPFSKAVEADVDMTLATYDIQDKATLRDYLSTRLYAQLLTGDDAGVRLTVAELRAAETKPDNALLVGRLPLAYVTALAEAKPTGSARLATDFATADRAAIDALPWNVVQDSVREQAGYEPIWSRVESVGRVGHDYDPIAGKTGTLDGPSARDLVQTRGLLMLLPFVPQDARILEAYITKHNVMKPDIWGSRDVALDSSQIKAPVRIGILDSGVDPHDYAALMFGGPTAQQHGLAFADDGGPSSSDLYPLPADVAQDYPKLVKLATGFSDMQEAVVSSDATATQAYLRSLSWTQDEALWREFDFFWEYVHGSQVAGIAVHGNSGARIVVARYGWLLNKPFAPTTEWANRMADNFARIGAFFRDNDVRVVNMSFSDQVSEFEHWLAKTDSTSDPRARKQKAQELYSIWRTAIEDMIKDTPSTLFVASAGNGDNDASFAQDVPASLVFPNLITVGAVNQAGDPTNFTSYGPTVAVYADGYRVLSKIPQGYAMKFSGTSAAAPGVTNLAAKLFALDPKLTPDQVRALIVNGAAPIQGGNLKLIDPKRSIALLSSMQ